MKKIIQNHYGKIIILGIIFLYIAGQLHSIKKHPDDDPNRRARELAFYRGIEMFFHKEKPANSNKDNEATTYEITSLKSYQCRKIAASDYEQQKNWTDDSEHIQDSIVAYGESLFKFFSGNGNYRAYKVIKNSGPLMGRPSGTAGFSYVCKNENNIDTEIIFEVNSMTKVFTVVLFEKDFAYEYKAHHVENPK